jgi:transglutaminase-like putative cysteine protease
MLEETTVDNNLEIMEKYSLPTPIFDSDNADIKEKALKLTQGLDDPTDKAKALFYFVRDEIPYNLHVEKHMPEHFRASNTLKRGKGYCVQKAVLLVTLTRSAGIPARLGLAKIRNNLVPQKVLDILKTNIFPWHGYAGLYLDGKWVKATPAFDLQTCETNGFIPVEFDGRNNAMLPSHDKQGNPHVEYLLDRGPFDTVPLEDIRKALIERNMLDPKDIVSPS